MPVFWAIGWFGNNWFIFVFAGIAIPSLLIWRRATYGLNPSLKTIEKADEITRKIVSDKMVILFNTSIVISAAIGFLLFGSLFLSNPPYPWLYLASGCLIWLSIVKFGFCNLICNHYTSRIKVEPANSRKTRPSNSEGIAE
jgi:hypothetical protein